MEERSGAPVCERGSELVSFLYGEIDQREARDFERHLPQCAECRSELSAFKEIRESIIAWRDESLNIAPSPEAFNESIAPATFGRPESRKRSAVAALGAFFDLSPLWMKGAVTLASVLFCLLAVLTVVRLFNRPEPAFVADEKRYSERELAARIDEAVQAKPREMNHGPNQASTPVLTTDIKPQNKRNPPKQLSQTAKAAPMVHRRPLTKAEREQLAADLRLVSPKAETDLDLLGDRLNQ